MVEGSRAGTALAAGEAIADRGVILPLFVGMTDDDQSRVVAALASALDEP